MDNKIVEKIKRRRLQVLVHSCIYYKFDDNIISDTTWNKWAHELVQLQKQYPEESKKADKYEVFKDFDGSTGMDLPLDDTWVMNKAKYLLKMKENPVVIKQQPVIAKPKKSCSRALF